MQKVSKNSNQQTTQVNISGSSNTEEQRSMVVSSWLSKGEPICNDLKYLNRKQIYYYLDEERGYVMDSDAMHAEFEHDLETVQSNLDEMNHEWLATQAIDNQD